MKQRWPILLVLLAIAGGTVALVRALADQPDLPPQTPEPTVAPTRPPPMPQVRVFEPPPVRAAAAEDAGLAAPHDIRIRVTKNGETAIGTRLSVLGLDGGLMSGTVDTMGVVVLPLDPGTWTVKSLRASPEVLLVTPETTELELAILPDRKISGRVVDARSEGVVGATVIASLKGNNFSTETSANGVFSIDTPTDEQLTVIATRGSDRSISHFVRAPQDGLSLQLEPMHSYTVSTTGPGMMTSRIVVRHRFGMNTCAATCRIDVPPGPVTASAVSFTGTRLVAAKAVTDIVQGPSERTLKLEGVPPLTGRLLDASGNPIPGATLRLNRFDLGSSGYLDPKAMPKAMGFDNTATTDTDGNFTVTFPLENFPIWVMTADAPNVLERRVLIVPFDGPIEIRTK